MAEYIEREAALRSFTVDKNGNRIREVDVDNWLVEIPIRQVKQMLREIPAADVVEVPCRCKDCKHWKHFDHLGCTDFVKVCGLANYMIGANGYCLYGERRDNDG